MKEFLANLKPVLITLLAGLSGVAIDTAGALLDSEQPLTARTIFTALGTAVVGYLVAWGKEHKVNVIKGVLTEVLKEQDTGPKSTNF